MIQQAGAKDRLVEDTGYIASLKMAVVPEMMTEAKSAIEDTWEAVDKQVWFTREIISLQKLIHHVLYNTWHNSSFYSAAIKHQ